MLLSYVSYKMGEFANDFFLCLTNGKLANASFLWFTKKKWQVCKCFFLMFHIRNWQFSKFCLILVHIKNRVGFLPEETYFFQDNGRNMVSSVFFQDLR